MAADFMPMGLDTYASQRASYSSRAASSDLIDELQSQGITINQPGESSSLDFEDFLQLMVQQLQNQTIDNTMDSSAMLNQLVQMSSVQMMASLQSSMATVADGIALSYAASLVGKTVTVGSFDEDNNLQEIVGTVTGTGTYQGVQVIFVDGEMYALSNIMAVGTLPEIPEEPEGEEPGQEPPAEGADEAEKTASA